jgi:hypothetical protein
MTNPSFTIMVLDELEPLGFNDESFSALHHFREKGRKTSISAHRDYCEQTEKFDENGANLRVQQRLGLVFKAYALGGFESKSSGVFLALSEAAYIEIPPTRHDQ